VLECLSFVKIIENHLVKVYKILLHVDSIVFVEWSAIILLLTVFLLFLWGIWRLTYPCLTYLSCCGVYWSV